MAFSSTDLHYNLLTFQILHGVPGYQNITHKKFTRNILYQSSAYLKCTSGLDYASPKVKDKIFISILKS